MLTVVFHLEEKAVSLKKFPYMPLKPRFQKSWNCLFFQSHSLFTTYQEDGVLFMMADPETRTASDMKFLSVGHFFQAHVAMIRISSINKPQDFICQERDPKKGDTAFACQMQCVNEVLYQLCKCK